MMSGMMSCLAGRFCRNRNSTATASRPAMVARATVRKRASNSRTATRVEGSEPLKISTPKTVDPSARGPVVRLVPQDSCLLHDCLRKMALLERRRQAVRTAAAAGRKPFGGTRTLPRQCYASGSVQSNNCHGYICPCHRLATSNWLTPTPPISAKAAQPRARACPPTDSSPPAGAGPGLTSRVYAELESMGMVSGETGRGTFVREPEWPAFLGTDTQTAAASMADELQLPVAAGPGRATARRLAPAGAVRRPGRAAALSAAWRPAP